MAEDTSTQLTESAGANNSTSEVAENTEQSASQGQEVGQDSVGNSGSSASSNGQQGRKPNSSWAAERVLEKKLAKMLDERLNPLIERFNSFNNPPAPKQAEPQVEDTPDYNNLSEWIKRKIAAETNANLRKFENEKLKGLDSQMEEKLAQREARTFLLTQPEIGGDQEKLEEIKEIMREEMLDYAAMHDPLGATKKAVAIWKQRRKSPNAPPRETLSTVNGGSGNVGGGKKGASVEELKALQNVIISDAPETEKQKAYERIAELSRMPV